MLHMRFREAARRVSALASVDLLRPVRTAGIVVVPLLLVLGATAPARAASGPRRDPKKEAAIVAELRSLSPEAVPDFEAATAAFDASDYRTAAAAYRRAVEKAPGSDAALRRLGASLVLTGQRAEGLALLEKAVAIRRTPENLVSLAQSLGHGDGKEKVPPDVLRRALTLVTEAAPLAPGDSDYLILKATLELELDEMGAFKATSRELGRTAPEAMYTHYFAAIRSAVDEEWTTAEREILEARRLGLPDEEVQRFLGTGIGARARAWRWGAWVAAATLAWALGLLLIFAAGKALSAATLRSIERDDPNATVPESARRLREAYRRLVTAAGLYWYVSLPFVALLVVAATGGVVYACLAVGRIPIKLLAIVVIGALVSLYAIARSLFIRVRDDEDPGRAVTEADAPGLWATAREVASAVGTRPIDEIWLTPGTDLAVLERGDARRRMKDEARRALILGAGVLDGFDQGAFRAVLAHEYGHFSHRDTAGGDVALRVQGGMMAFLIALAKAGYAVWWNLAFQFLRLYDLLFRRVSHGATRLQEVLADRVAIQQYGLEAFQVGLTHVIRRSIHFGALASTEIDEAMKGKRAIANLYALAPPSDAKVVASLEESLAERLAAETTEDDTHPSPKHRFQLGQRIRSTATYAPGGAVWDLFANATALTAEMTELVATRVRLAAAAEGAAAP